MSARENRRQRDKKPMLPFGDLMLPIIGLIAVGLLIVGVKFFFLSEPAREPHKPVVVQESPAPSQESVPFAAAPVASSPAPAVPEQVAAPVTAQPNSEVTAKTTTAATSIVATTTEQTEKVAPPTGNSNWGVQIGSFKSSDAANRLKTKVSKEGYNAFVSKAVVKNSTYYRVTVSAGNQRNEADKCAAQLKQAGYPILVVRLQ